MEITPVAGVASKDIKITNANAACVGGGKLRLTFDWPQHIQEVFIADTKDVTSSTTSGKVYTLQEYKKNGGFFTAKLPGCTHYYICPMLDGTILHQPDGNIASHIETVRIRYKMYERTGAYKYYDISLSADYIVPAGIIYYVKKAGAPPSSINDGMQYSIDIPLTPGKELLQVIRTSRTEYLQFFTRGEYYALV